MSIWRVFTSRSHRLVQSRHDFSMKEGWELNADELSDAGLMAAPIQLEM